MRMELVHVWREILIRVIHRYFSHDVGRQAAALAYYLLFTLFPFLVFVSSFLGVLQLDVSGISAALAPFLPSEVVHLLSSYLTHVAVAPSEALLWFGLLFSLWFPMRAVSCLMRAVRRAYHLSVPQRLLRYRVKVLLYTVFLLLTIALSLVLMTLGQRSLYLIENFLPTGFPRGFVEIWDILRFLLLFAGRRRD